MENSTCDKKYVYAKDYKGIVYRFPRDPYLSRPEFSNLYIIIKREEYDKERKI